MKVKQTVLFLSISTLACLYSVTASIAADSEFIFRGGLARADAKGTLDIYKETTEIPLITKAVDPDYHFGAIVNAKDENTCKCKVVIRIPKTRDVKVNPSNESDQNKSKIDSTNSDYTTVTSDEEKCSTIYYALMQFDEGDLPGTYSIEIYIDNALKKRFDFNVVPVAKKGLL
jgi:hypothetical protein